MSHSGRRRFLVSAAAAPLLPAAFLQTAPAPPAPSPAPLASPSPEPNPVADALDEVARHRYGAHFAPGDFAEVQKAIAANLRAAERLQKGVTLTNGDEPVTLFEARPPVPRPGPARRR